MSSAVHEPARSMEPLDSRLEDPRSRQKTAKKPPRGSSLESSRLVDPCPSWVESPGGSSRLVNHFSSRQELDAKRLEVAQVESKLDSSRLEPGSSPLRSCATLSVSEHQQGVEPEGESVETHDSDPSCLSLSLEESQASQPCLERICIVNEIERAGCQVVQLGVGGAIGGVF